MSQAPRQRNLLHRVKQTEHRSKGIGTVRAREWRAFALINSWDFDDTFAPPGFHRSDGYVYLRGVLTGGATGTDIGVLPEGYRPEFPLRIPTVCSGMDAARVNIDTDGSVSVNGPGVATWVTLDGLGFRAFA